MEPGSTDYGHALEHLVVQEVIAYLTYKRSRLAATYWRSASGFEVDIVIIDNYTRNPVCAIEVKSCNEVQNRHLKGLRAFGEEYPELKRICLSHDKQPRKTDDGIVILPVEEYLAGMWKESYF